MALSSYWNETPQPDTANNWRSPTWKKSRFTAGVEGKPHFQKWLTDLAYAAVLRSLEVHGSKHEVKYGGDVGFYHFWLFWRYDMLKDTPASFFWNISSWGNGVLQPRARAPRPRRPRIWLSTTSPT